MIGIVAEGEINCPRKAYESIAGWSLSTDFPTLADQEALLASMIERETAQNAPQPAAEPQAAAAKARTHARPRKEAPRAETFYIEGDDAVVGYDPARGIAETSTGKLFALDKAAAQASANGWQDYPVHVHYRCDQADLCTISAPGGGVLSARLRR